MTEVVKRLADPACWEALNEAIEPLVLHAEEEDLNATIAMLAKDENFAAEYGKNSLYEALKLLAQHAIAKQLHAAILALLATSEQLEAIIEACLTHCEVANA